MAGEGSEHDSPTPQDLFVDYLCLVYHEARNVRHLIKKNLVDGEGFERLISLPTNRKKAWEGMGALRMRAKASGTATGAAKIFEGELGKSLEALIVLYENPHWRNAGAVGGYPWIRIAQRVLELRDVLDGGDSARISQLLEDIPQLQHNTGLLGDKLRDLEA